MKVDQHSNPFPREPRDCVVIEEGMVSATTKDGISGRISIGRFLELAAPRRMDSGGVLPEGVVAIVSHPRVPAVIWVGQIPPRVWHFSWIRPDSPAPFGADAAYQPVSISLPYIYLFVPFIPGAFADSEQGLVLDRKKVELFFGVAPLLSLGFEGERRDPGPEEPGALFLPALLNVSKFLASWQDKQHKPISWLCTQHIGQKPGMESKATDVRMRAYYEAVLEVLFGAKFSYSSEHHQSQGEECSWYTWYQRRHIDPRLEIQAWQKATRQNPLFVLEVPWAYSGYNAATLCERMFTTTLEIPVPAKPTAGSLVNLILNHS